MDDTLKYIWDSLAVATPVSAQFVQLRLKFVGLVSYSITCFAGGSPCRSLICE